MFPHEANACQRATFAWPCDLCVQEGWRGQGVSRRMLEAFERQPDLQTLRRRCLATRDYHGLYEQFGHRPVPADRWTAKQCPKERWQGGGA
jgi:GNAT superfamily N-acetyltransferase